METQRVKKGRSPRRNSDPLEVRKVKRQLNFKGGEEHSLTVSIREKTRRRKAK